jgi:hypothetical protein
MNDEDVTGIQSSNVRGVCPVGFETAYAQFAPEKLLLVSGYQTVMLYAENPLPKLSVQPAGVAAVAVQLNT